MISKWIRKFDGTEILSIDFSPYVCLLNATC